MHRLFAPVLAPLLEALRPRTIVEVGAGSGRLTRKLLEAPGAATATIHAVDPSPALDPAMIDQAGERLQVHRERAVSAVGRIGAVDFAILDGDPNWYSVHAELKMLVEASRRADRPPPVFVIHHVHWPFGRRDGYHDPAAIPQARRHRYSELGLLPGSREPRTGGLRLTPYAAQRDFEPRSGVLSAVEDAIAESDLDWKMVEVPGFHGCAVLAEARLLAERRTLTKVIEDLGGSRFLRSQARRAEAARLAAEVELAADRVDPATEQPHGGSQEVAQSEPDPQAAGVASAGLAEQAEGQARTAALEWRLERLEEDVAEREKRLGEAEEGREEARATLVEASVRLEGAKQELERERSALGRANAHVEVLEQDVEATSRELDQTLEREQLAQGRLSHREDALQAATAEVDQLRGAVATLEAQLGASREQLDEVAEQLERAAGRRSARLGRGLRRLGRALSFRRAERSEPREQALAAARRPLPAGDPPSMQDDEEGVWSPGRPEGAGNRTLGG